MNDSLYTAFVDLNIGGYSLSPIPPQYLVDFNYKRNTADNANHFSFMLYDELALEVEYAIMTAKDRYIHFSYGYVGGNRSATRIGYISDYSLDFREGGAVGLSVEGISNAIVSGKGLLKTKEYVDMMIHDIVIDVAKEEGWVCGNIEPTEKVPEVHWKTKKIVNKTYVRQNETATSFLNKLLVDSKSVNTKDANYSYYFDDNVTCTVLHYCTPNFTSRTTSKDYIFMYNRVGQEVISFSPEIKGREFLNGAATVGYSNYDSISNDLVDASYNSTSNELSLKQGPKTEIDPNSAKMMYVGPALTQEEFNNRLSSLWNRAAQRVYGASMVVRGNTSLVPNNLITVLVLNRNGKSHHSSGFYLIREIEDSISGGKFTSTLTLLKNSGSLGPYSAGGIDINKR